MSLRSYSKESVNLCPADLQRISSRVAHTPSNRELALMERKTINNQHTFMNIPKVQTNYYVIKFFEIPVFRTLPFLPIYFLSSSFSTDGKV